MQSFASSPASTSSSCSSTSRPLGRRAASKTSHRTSRPPRSHPVPLQLPLSSPRAACCIPRLMTSPVVTSVRRSHSNLACLASSLTPFPSPSPAPSRSSARASAPVLLFDVMDTVVADPFRHKMAPFFDLSFEQLLQQKHPTAWIEFEKGRLSEKQFAESFFRDGRAIDLQGLRECMASHYEWLPGMKSLLHQLSLAGVDMHAFTNYPSWYLMIEDKLTLSRYLHWTFVSCHTGLRKPDCAAFQHAVKQLGVEPAQCIFVDDRPENVHAAESIGMHGLHFTSSSLLATDLSHLLDLHLHLTAAPDSST